MARKLALLLALVLITTTAFAADTGARGGTLGGPPPLPEPEALSEGFEDITNLPGWFFQNNSQPLGVTNWFQGNSGVFPAQAGSATSYLGANFNNASGTGTISNWALTPVINWQDTASVSFWTRTVTGSIWPDRLEVRLSTTGASTNVGTLATDVGDFTNLLTSINPSLVQGGYPQVWTQFSINSFPASGSGRIAFRYFVTNGGPSGSNSNYIGIDTLEIVDLPCQLTCPANINAVVPSPGTSTIVNYSAPGTSGPCGAVACVPPSGSSFPLGTTTVTCTSATQTTCAFDVTVSQTASLIEIPTLGTLGLALLALLLAGGAFFLIRRRANA